MASYKFKQNYSAVGGNVVPPGAGLATFRLTRNFIAGEQVNGEMLDGAPKIQITTIGGINSHGGAYSGNATYDIPTEILEKISDTSIIKDGGSPSPAPIITKTPPKFQLTPTTAVIATIIVLGVAYYLSKAIFK